MRLPDDVDFPLAAAAVGDGLKAYTALYSLARLEAGDTVLVLGGGLSWGCLLTQLAQQWGAKVNQGQTAVMQVWSRSLYYTTA